MSVRFSRSSIPTLLHRLCALKTPAILPQYSRFPQTQSPMLLSHPTVMPHPKPLFHPYPPNAPPYQVYSQSHFPTKNPGPAHLCNTKRCPRKYTNESKNSNTAPSFFSCKLASCLSHPKSIYNPNKRNT
jgi:hypothetical protein